MVKTFYNVIMKLQSSLAYSYVLRELRCTTKVVNQDGTALLNVPVTGAFFYLFGGKRDETKNRE